jgi:hypothetical protein
MIEDNELTGEIGFSCDSYSCSETFEGISDKSEFVKAITGAKKEGWLIRLINDGWLFFCSRECYYEYLEPKKKKIN